MLYVIGQDVTVDLSVNWQKFSLSYTCVIILVLMVIMTIPRDTSYIRKVNGLGVIFIMIFLSFLIINGIISVFNTDYTFSQSAYEAYQNEVETGTDEDYLAYIPLVNSNFIPVMGILGGGFYFHNMALPLAANAAEPEKNTRNIFIGFLCVFATYAIVGVAGVYGFNGINYADYEPSVNLI